MSNSTTARPGGSGSRGTLGRWGDALARRLGRGEERPAAPADPSQQVLTAVRAGHLGPVPGLLAVLDDPARRALLPELKRLRDEHLADRTGIGQAAHLAGAGCHTGPAACAAWLRGRRWYLRDQDPAVLVEVLAARPPRFLADLAERLAARGEMQAWDFRLLLRLAERAGTEVPVTEASAGGWRQTVVLRVRGACRCVSWRRPTGVGPEEGCGALLRVLREDPQAPRMLPALLDTAGGPGGLMWRPCHASEHAMDTWQGATALLAEERLLDREGLTRTAAAVLLRGTGASADVRFCVGLLRALRLTPAEDAALAQDWIRAACDAPAEAAGFAQERLRGLWDAGLLTPEQCAEAAAGVLFRTEKKLLRAQLSWLDAAMKSRPAAAPVLLPPLADAFRQPDTTLVERALRIAGRHLAAAGPAAREDVLSAAAELSAGLRPLAAKHLRAPALTGTGPTPEPAAEPAAAAGDALASGPSAPDLLPAARPPQRMPAPAGSGEEVAAGVEAALDAEVRGLQDVVAFEWALDGIVRGMRRDRAGTFSALEAVAAARLGWAGSGPEAVVRLEGSYRQLLLPVAAATRRIRAKDVRRVREAGTRADGQEARLAVPWKQRVAEVAEGLLGAEVPPMLLATPTYGSGVLEADDLLDRLRAYRDAGVRAWPVDLDVALLRVRRPGDPGPAVAAARALGTPEALRLAGWLAAEEPAEPEPVRVRLDRGDGKERTAFAVGPSSALAAAFPALGCFGDGYQPRSGWSSGVYAYGRYWTSMLPGRPETVAVHLVDYFAGNAVYDTACDTGLLLTLAEAPGTPGPAVRLALGYGLSARRPEDRLAAVDALLVLAARGALDGAGLGADLAELLLLGAVKANRVADALAAAVAAGAPATAWSVLAALLPPLLAPGARPPRGTGDFLAAAATAVEACGARGSSPWLEEAAARRGSTRLLTEARRLHRALTG